MITLTAPSMRPTRFHPRVDAGFMVKLSTRGRTLVAKASDLSMAGLKLRGDFRGTEDRVTLSIPLPGDREVVTKATVRRRAEDELALEFDPLDWDDLFALARFVHPRLE
jgi:hypothetical protein